MITVAAIIPVYNVKRYLSRCLDSVLNQTRPFEKIIVVNDGSTDGSQDICIEYASNYKTIQLINKPNGGLVSAWMEGLKYVDTSYICFIDSDDYIALDYLETLVGGLGIDVDMVCMNATRAFDTGKFRAFRINNLDAGTYQTDGEFLGKMLSDQGSFFHPIALCRWAKLLRTDIVLKYAQYCSTEISYGEDQQLTFGIMLGCKKINVLDEFKYFYQYNTSSIVNTYKKNLLEKFELLMNTISQIPGMRNIPDFQRQYNTQFLLLFCQCIRNESYNRSLTKKTYTNLLNHNSVQTALKDHYDKKMRRIDKIIITYAKKKKYRTTKLFLGLYKLIYMIRKVPG